MILPDDYISFHNFVCSLQVDFSTNDNIPLETSEENWKIWGNIVAASPSFVKAGVPTTDGFSNWRDWGKMLYSIFG